MGMWTVTLLFHDNRIKEFKSCNVTLDKNWVTIIDLSDDYDIITYPTSRVKRITIKLGGSLWQI